MGSKDDKIVNKLSFTTTGDEHQNHIAWIAFRTKLLAAARTLKINKAVLHNKKADGTTDADTEQLAEAWSLIVTPIQDPMLVTTLAARFADDTKEIYNPAGAFKYLNERYGNTSDDKTKVEAEIRRRAAEGRSVAT